MFRIISLGLVISLLMITTACQPNSQPAKDDSTSSSTDADVIADENVKVFNLDSFMNMNEDGTRVAGFSVKEIVVKKGDKVRILVNNIKGTHDFVLDEFNVKQETPEGQVTAIEFTADKSGEYKYYCSKYDHRQLGQEGTLIVED
ncbi:MAG: cupredoxin domain-containing protein [Candidatus Gracilibacteria bacterium]|jgi:heme/copper-type cytochrome/quinol oxidase subunit 2